MSFIANARMYAVSREAEAVWRDLLAHVAKDAGTSFEYEVYAAPLSLEALWRRKDLGCVQMCGYPIALNIAEVVPLASPIPAAAWSGGKAVYRSDLIVRHDADYEVLEDTFAGTVGWTVEHSHSGFNALRHHLLSYRSSSERPNLYQESVGQLITARRILDSVLDGTIDVGPLDAYWHMLIRKYQPDLSAGVRILDSTENAPMPAFVAAPTLSVDLVDRLRNAFVEAHLQAWFPALGDALLIKGFEAVTHQTFDVTRVWDAAAKAEGYPVPA